MAALGGFDIRVAAPLIPRVLLVAREAAGRRSGGGCAVDRLTPSVSAGLTAPLPHSDEVEGLQAAATPKAGGATALIVPLGAVAHVNGTHWWLHIGTLLC